MIIDIKCLKCGKGTRDYDLGTVFVFNSDTEDCILVKNPVICPKCKRDVSDRKFAVKRHEFWPMVFAASLPIPFKSLLTPHLAGLKALDAHKYEGFNRSCKARPKVVRSFRQCS